MKREWITSDNEFIVLICIANSMQFFDPCQEIAPQASIKSFIHKHKVSNKTTTPSMHIVIKPTSTYYIIDNFTFMILEYAHWQRKPLKTTEKKKQHKNVKKRTVALYWITSYQIQIEYEEWRCCCSILEKELPISNACVWVGFYEFAFHSICFDRGFICALCRLKNSCRQFVVVDFEIWKGLPRSIAFMNILLFDFFHFTSCAYIARITSMLEMKWYNTTCLVVSAPFWISFFVPLEMEIVSFLA